MTVEKNMEVDQWFEIRTRKSLHLIEQELLAAYFADQNSKHYSFISAQLDLCFSHIPLTFTHFAPYILFCNFQILTHNIFSFF